jgi:small subunit ribosomal protein S6
MSEHKPIYDLVLLLDPAAADGVREKVLADTERTIQAQGELIGHHDWGQRTMAYEIRHQTLADYHLLQFHATSALLESLQRTLRITDGIIRFRIIKLAPGTPEPPEVRPEPVAVAAAGAAPVTEAAAVTESAAPAVASAPDAAPAAAAESAAEPAAPAPEPSAPAPEAEVPTPAPEAAAEPETETAAEPDAPAAGDSA